MEEQGHKCQTITSFEGDYDFLSNFYEAPVTYQGLNYLSSESAYQAQKAPEHKGEFTRLTPMKAKKLARKLETREDW